MAERALDLTSATTPDEVTAALTDVEITALVEAARAAPDERLEALLDRDELRPAAVAAVARRVPEVVIERQLRGATGTARVDVAHRGRPVAHHLLRVADGRLATEIGVPADTRADVVLGCSALGFLRLVTGERNAGLEHLAGRLEIEGDSALALVLGGMFPAARPGGGDPVPVDPRALRPADVSRAVAQASTGHLRRVMASGFRGIVLDELFRQLPDHLNEERARDLRVTVAFRLTGRVVGDDGGDGDATADRYLVRLADGRAEVRAGDAADAVGREQRDATVTAAAHDFLRLATGHLSPVTGVLRGLLKVRGDKAAALRLAGAFDVPAHALD